MRIRLEGGKQKELILLAKNNLTWKDFSSILELSSLYLSRDLKDEKVTLSEKLYDQLCEMALVNYDNFIQEKLQDNWGKSKGGFSSEGSTKKLKLIIKNSLLAEFIGAVLGDGHVCSYKKGNKIGTYMIRMSGDLKLDGDYHLNYLRPLIYKIFKFSSKEILMPKKNERFLDIYGKRVVEIFNEMGIKAGNKITNQSTIPSWIFKNKSYLSACLRGLIDTDGSIFRMSRKDPHLLRISFTNHNQTLLNDARNGFVKLGFFPSKIINNRQFYLSRKSDIKKFLNEIGFSNKRHINRFKLFTAP